EVSMAFYDRPHDRNYGYSRQPRTFDSWGNSALPLIIIAAIVLALIAMFYPFGNGARIGDTTNTGPSVKTVTPAPAPSTSPVVPSPNPTTEPRPPQTPVP